MSWLLDADVLSQAAKRRGDRRVIAWLEREEASCHTSTVVVAQLAYWVRTKKEGDARPCSSGSGSYSMHGRGAYWASA